MSEIDLNLKFVSQSAGGAFEMNQVRIVLLSGAFGVGKSAATTELINEFGFQKVSTSAYLRSFIPDASLSETELRRQLQEAGDRLDAETDYTWVVDPVTIRAIEQAPDTKGWIIDAVRKARQVEHFRSRFGSAVRHVHLEAPEAVLRSRYAHSDDDYSNAVSHPNEVSARSLRSIADCLIETSTQTPEQVASSIIKNWS
ncbi:AAA family ATPase [Xanthomonas dyei]|uniref:Cytidylate kinase n=3 Tax=Xanthomonas TaxID=338 RepID=A0A2S7CBM6_9XANT|nr:MULTISPECIES: AAA family ATPase [Xanthomonas]MEA5126209.1 hypothetical protein [Xanthomonas floridensis]MEA5134125.1 hypothetical protein [Xanthomonas floridensis]PPU58974.1 hypothetical protein XdyCFBP7245_00570 [Xanthomonas dyei]